MSSILKALQKLERDKEARQAKPADIQRGILRQSTRRSAQAHWKLPVAILATALLAVLGTYLFMGGGNRTGQQTASTPVAPATVPAPTATETVVLPQPVPPVPPEQQAISTDRPAIVAPRPAPPRITLNNDDEPAHPAEPIQETAAPAPAPAPAPASAPAPAAPPRFSVAGIGWRDDPASRRAMVNGSPVKVGSVVDGARVEEILHDRVRFSFQHRGFEVAVGGSGSAPP